MNSQEDSGQGSKEVTIPLKLALEDFLYTTVVSLPLYGQVQIPVGISIFYLENISSPRFNNLLKDRQLD